MDYNEIINCLQLDKYKKINLCHSQALMLKNKYTVSPT